ncbi:MAG: recombination regulator RecX [Thermoanaerobaculia bacterium]|nr:recombination regulator RecX [Thermoanaerobaculia bacterium]
MSPRVPKSCREKALDLLARRSHFRRELERKLTRRGYDEFEIEETLERLTQGGWLDDVRTAEEFVATRLRRGPVGPAKLRTELRARGVDDDDARRVVAAAQPNGDLELARTAAEGKVRHAPDVMDTETLHKLLRSVARHLQGKGFSGESIGRVVDEVRHRLEP